MAKKPIELEKPRVHHCKKCNRTRCPSVAQLPDGSFEIFDEDLPGKPRVPMTREQAEEIVDFLANILWEADE